MRWFADLPSATRLTCLGCRGTLGAVKSWGEDTALAKQGFPFPITRLGGAFDRGNFPAVFFCKKPLQSGEKCDIMNAIKYILSRVA